MKLNIKKTLKGSLISLAVLGMVGGSLNTPNVSAHKRYRIHRVSNHKTRRIHYKFGYWKHHHFHHYKTGYFRNGKWIHKLHRHHASRKVYHLNGHTYHSKKNYEKALHKNAVVKNNKTKHPKRHRSTYKNRRAFRKARKAKAIANNLKEFKQQTITDINNDRQKNGLSPLTETPELNQLAKTRANQIQNDYDHVDNGESDNYSENIDETSPGQAVLNDGTPVNNKNGYDMANNEENELMNHDAISDWGHKQNILDPTSHQIGVGTSYGHHDDFPYKVAEDFE